MNRLLLPAAALALVFALAACGGDDKIKVVQGGSTATATQGDTPQDAIPFAVDGPNPMYASSGSTNAFYTTNIGAIKAMFWVNPIPASPLNDIKFSATLDPSFLNTTFTSFACCGLYAAEVDVLSPGVATPVYLRVYPESPTTTLTYEIWVATGSAAGTSIGSGQPNSPGAPQAISAGQTFLSINPTGINTYFQVTPAVSGTYLVKGTSFTSSPYNVFAYSDSAFSMSTGFCWNDSSTFIDSCLVPATAGTDFFIEIQNGTGSSLTMDLSVIGP